jgi:hypothetical protein
MSTAEQKPAILRRKSWPVELIVAEAGKQVSAVACAPKSWRMPGAQLELAQLFYEFRIDKHVPADHLLRRIDRFLELESVRS